MTAINKIDYTYENNLPELTQIKQYKGITPSSTTSVEVVMIYHITTSGTKKISRIVLIGEEKQTGKGYIMKIIDISNIPENIAAIETTVTNDNGKRKIVTNDLESLKKNSEFNKIFSEITK